MALVRQGPRALRRSSRNTKPRSRQRRNRLLRSRRNRSRIHRRRLSRSKQNRLPLRHDRNRRPVARPRTLPLRRSRVLHPRRQGPMLGRPLVPYPCGIRRRRQHLNKASGRGWGLVGRPSCLRTMWQLRLRSNLGFLPCSRRQPHPVGRMRRLRSHVRVLRPGSRLVRRCSRGPLERRLGASLEHLLLRALQRQPVWRLQQRLRSVRRRQPGSLARPLSPAVLAGPPAVRPPAPADQLVLRSLLPEDHKRACPPHRPLLRRGRRVRRCSHQLRRQSRCQNRSSRTP